MHYYGASFSAVGKECHIYKLLGQSNSFHNRRSAKRSSRMSDGRMYKQFWVGTVKRRMKAQCACQNKRRINRTQVLNKLHVGLYATYDKGITQLCYNVFCLFIFVYYHETHCKVFRSGSDWLPCFSYFPSLLTKKIPTYIIRLLAAYFFYALRSSVLSNDHGISQLFGYCVLCFGQSHLSWFLRFSF